MQVPDQVFYLTVIAIFLIGVFDVFRIYLRVFRRYRKLMWGFLPSHVAGMAFAGLRFLPYVVGMLIVLAIGNML